MNSKKKPVFLSKQYFHQRSEARSGKKSKFGTYKYTAADLYNRGEHSARSRRDTCWVPAGLKLEITPQVPS